MSCTAQKSYEQKKIASIKARFGVAAYDPALVSEWPSVTNYAAIAKVEVDMSLDKIRLLDEKILRASRGCRVRPTEDPFPSTVPVDGKGNSKGKLPVDWVDVSTHESLPSSSSGARAVD